MQAPMLLCAHHSPAMDCAADAGLKPIRAPGFEAPAISGTLSAWEWLWRGDGRGAGQARHFCGGAL